ncbi:MAG: type II toxin-antitoxin system VapC family toxin [Planctomycetales bacterium]|nr:type II toxin-antitoxin system VapC family toxin [Planctomycetales bacterium]
MTRLVLDTCTFIQWAVNPGLIKEDARFAIASGRSFVFVSAATTWEMAIKTRLGKLDETPSVLDLMRAERFTELPITIEHTEETKQLPLLHRDPFDRLLVAQARKESLTLVTSDSEIPKYDVSTLAA